MPSPALRIAIVSPLIVLFVYVAGVTPDVPLLDDWAFADFAHRVATGEATLRDWLAPHNGSHVVVLPRVVMTAIMMATGGSGRVQLLVSAALVAWTVWVIVRIGIGSPAAARPALHWAWIATALLLCSPASYRAFIWPVAFCHFTVNACVVTAAWLLARPGEERAGRGFAWAALACVAASLTRAEGLAAWVVLLPSVWLLSAERAKRIRFVGIWLTAMAACIALVAYSLMALAPDDSAPLPKALLAQPVETLGNALGLIGMPFGIALDPLIGTALPSPRRYFWLGLPVVAAFLYWGLRGLRSPDVAVRRTTGTWLSIGTFGGLFVAATATARVGVLESAFLGEIWPSNYAVTAALVGVAALQLAGSNAATRADTPPRSLGARHVAATLTIALLLGGFVTRGPDALHQRARSRWSGLCWELFEHLAPFNACFVRQPKREKVRIWEDLGFRKIRSDVRALPEPNARAGAVEGVIGPGRDPNQREVEGWVHPEPGEAPPIVFLEIERFPGLFAPARVSAPDGERAQWRADVLVLEGDTRVKAWVYRREKGVLVRLAGELRVPFEAANAP